MSRLQVGAVLLSSCLFAACGGQFDFEVSEDPDGGLGGEPAPTVISTLPANAAIGVALSSPVSVTFSKAMDPGTLTALTFMVKQGAAPISGAVKFDRASNTATFKPDALLGNHLLYTATVTTGARDTANTPLPADDTWTFTTAAAAPPTVVSITPLDGAANESTGIHPTATFSKAMDPGTLTSVTFTVKQGVTPVSGVVSFDRANNTVTFAPGSTLGNGLPYRATVTMGARDTTNTPLAADRTWSFTTVATVAPPTVLSTTPLDGATNVSTGAQPTATFSKAMNPSTLTALTFTVRQGSTPVPGTVSFVGATNTATFIPGAALGKGLLYTVTLTTGARDTWSTPLAADRTWTFTTATVVPPTVLSTAPMNGAISVALGVQPTATFSKAMDPSTLTALTFTVKQGSTPVPGAVSLGGAGNTATFTPVAALGNNMLYTATITTGARDTTNTALAADRTWTFTTAAAPVPPTVLSTSPLNFSTDVAIGAQPSATFSTAMDPSTLTALTFTVKQGSTPVSGAVSWDGASSTATFIPTAALANDLTYTVTITTGARDLGTTALAADHSWSFTTAVAPPTVLSTTPLSGATSVAIGAQPTATFSRAMDPSTLTSLTFTVKQGSAPVSGAVNLDGANNTATFTPFGALGNGLLYTATVTTRVRDLANTAMAADRTWTFTTAPAVAPPTVLSTTPLDGATSVSIRMKPTATFSAAMDPSTLTSLTFTLRQGPGLTPVSGLVTFASATNTATFTPAVVLGNGLLYTATITAGARALGNAALAADYSWTFTSSACGLAPVLLGAASDFVVLAGTTVTNTGLSSLTGNLGVSPGSAVTGFPPGILVGTQHVSDATAVSAQSDLTAAYNDAAGRTLCAVTVAPSIGGLTLGPGLYKAADVMDLTAGDVRLDGQGDPDAVFIFQIGTSFSAAAGQKVLLLGKAKAANVFWYVGTTATLAAITEFKGTIMAGTTITIGAGGLLDGRMLARAGAVTLDSNTFVQPAP